MEDVKQPIIIKKINAGHGHHGGSWKVAFADFATAMMAFFMVLWLVGQTDAQQRGGIAEYFQNPSMVPGLSEAPTGAMGPGGASTSLIALGGTYDPPKKQTATVDSIVDKTNTEVKKMELQQEIKKLDAILKNLKESMRTSETLGPYREQLLMNIAPDGLRIQIIDNEDRPMFDSGSANLKPYTAEILYEVAHNISDIPNHVSITGHTDSAPYTGRRNYSNWELSADRANAARRALIEGGMTEDRIGRVVGLADSIPYDPADPKSSVNRRINIVVMNRSAYDAMTEGEAPPQKITSLTDQLQQEKPEEISVTDPLNIDTQIPFRESNLYEEEPKPVVAPAIVPKKTVTPKKETKTTGEKPRKPNNVVKRPLPVKRFIDLPPIIDPSLVPGSPGQQ